MTCLEVAEFLLEYVEGELPGPVRREFEFHLRECPTCVTYLENYRKTIRVTKIAHAPDPGGSAPPLPEDLVRAILDALDTRGGRA